MPKISELNEITYVDSNDLLATVHDPNGLPSTNRITVNNFTSSIFSSVTSSHIPSSNNSLDLGSVNKEWRDAYVGNTIFINSIPVTAAANGELIVNGVSINPAGGSAGYTGSAGNDGYTGSMGGTGFTGSHGDAGYTGSAGTGTTGYTGSIGGTGFTGSAGSGSSGPYSNLVHGSYTATLNGDGSLSIPTVIKKFTNSYTALIDPTQNGGGSFVIENFSGYDSPQKITFDGANYVVKITSNDSNYTFGNTGIFTIPVGGDIQFANGHTALGGTGGGTGYTGSQGGTGYTGSEGIIGYTGSQGDTGYTGSEGMIGYTGSEGIIGYTGSEGIIGYTGSAGADGAGSGPSSNLVNGSYALTLNDNGTLTLPSNGSGRGEILAFGSDYASLVSNTGAEIYYLNSDQGSGNYGPNTSLYSDLYVTSAGMELDVGRTDNSNTTINYTWLWDMNGNFTIPDGGGIVNSTGYSILGIVNTDASYTWSNNHTFSKPVTFNANVTTYGKFIGDGSLLTNLTVTQQANIVGSQANVSLIAGNNSYIFDNTGTFTMPANGDIILPGASANLSVGGTVLASNFTSYTGSWTLATGANVKDFSVPGPGTYTLWVNGNIASGIVTYTATVVVTNQNVPVVGSSYGWYYTAGNALVLTSIPNQIVGTLNSISTNTVSTTTAWKFSFGITNNSGSSQTINYGYTRLG